MTTTSNYMCDVVVEIAFNAGWSTPAASRTWTDVSAYVELQRSVQITHGRGAEFTVADASRLTLTLDNRDGRFTPLKASSPYYPNVKLGRPIRVRSTRPGGAASTRFVGFIEAWPPSWDDGTDASNYVAISATSRLAWLGGKKIANVVEQALLAQSPTLLYPLTEAAGAGFASNRTTTSAPDLRTYRSDDTEPGILFGAGVGPQGEPVVKGQSLAGAWLTGSTSTPWAATGEWPPMTVLTYVSGAGVGGFAVPVLIATGDALAPGNALTLVVSVAQMSAYIEGNTAFVSSLPSGESIMNGSPRAIGCTYSGVGTRTLRQFIDGIDVGSAAQTVDSTTPSGVDTLVVNQSANYPDTQGMSQAYVAIWFGRALTPTEMADMSAAILGWPGELPGNRIEHYAALAGIPSTEVSAEDGVTPMAAIDGVGRSVVDLMRNVEATEGGVLFDGKDGTLTFHARAHRYTAASSFTLSFATQQIESGYAPKYDTQGVQNDVTAALADGTAEAHAINEGSVDDYGQRGDALTLHTTDENEPHAAAWWRVNAYSEPRVRVPQLSVDFLVLSSALQDSLYAAGVGTRFATTGRPSQDTASTGDYFIEGWTETYGPESCRFTFNVSDAGPYVNTFVLQDATRGQLDGTYRLGY